MRITKWTRTLSVALAAGGLAPPVAFAADLRTNLAVNPSFENVDANTPGPFTSVTLLNWVDPTPSDPTTSGSLVGDAYAYPYASAYSGVPAPPSSGVYHFAGGFNTTTDEVQVAQTIGGLATGATGTQIATGSARFDLSGFFSTYFTQSDVAFLQVRFLNSGGAQLGTSRIGGPDFLAGLPQLDGRTSWGQDRVTGTVPVGTSQAVVEVLSAGGGGNYDGYVDLVDLRIGGLPGDLGLQLQVDPTTGRSLIRNLTGAPVALNYYEVASPSGALNAVSWNSLQEQDFEGSGGASGGTGWEAAGGVSSSVIAESFLQGSSTVGAGTVNLGAAFRPTGSRDLVFRYGTPDGLLLYGNVQYEPIVALTGDYNGDGAVNAADYTVWRDTLNSTTNLAADGNNDGSVNAADYNVWVANYGAGSTATAVPEPGALVLVAAASAFVCSTRRGRKPE
ncbi:MAG: dockerin type I repeat-containing protein [Lacipirellulaceae bacterium]